MADGLFYGESFHYSGNRDPNFDRFSRVATSVRAIFSIVIALSAMKKKIEQCKYS